jgi:hypothetical protein
MTRKTTRITIPHAPPDYNRRYMAELVRALEVLVDELRNPIMNMQGLPSVGDANMLENGDIYEEAGHLKIKCENEVFSGSFEMSSGVGTVTVTTT